MSAAHPGPERPARPRRSLGQNFLVDGNLPRRIVEALDAGPADVVLEIGPGRGALTVHLAGTVRRLVLVELDDELANHWTEAFAGADDVVVLHRDILKVSLAKHVGDVGSLLVVGNIPYNITTPILFHLLARPRPARIVLMVQKEVGDRIVAAAGSSAYGALAVGVQSVADTRRLFGVARTAFRPVPKVDSVVIEIRPHAPPRLSPADEADLRVLTRALFQWRRKQVQKTLRDHPDLQVDRPRVDALGRELRLDLRRRPETLPPETLLALSRAIR